MIDALTAGAAFRTFAGSEPSPADCERLAAVLNRILPDLLASLPDETFDMDLWAFAATFRHLALEGVNGARD